LFEGVAIGVAQASVDNARGTRKFLDGAPLSKEHTREGQREDTGIVGVSARDCVERLLIGALLVENACQTLLGEAEHLLTEVLLGGEESSLEEWQGFIQAVLRDEESC